MKIILIGSSGAGKSTFSRELANLVNFPVLHLDKIWHSMDYSEKAEKKFRQVQENFLAEHENCIIDGNYRGTLGLRVAQADLIIWLKISRWRAVGRVFRRSLKWHWSRKNRPDMAEDFTEKFDKEYWEFIKFVWNFPKFNEPKISEIIQQFDKVHQVVIVKNQKDKKKVLSNLQRDLIGL